VDLNALGCSSGFKMSEDGLVSERREHPGICVMFFSQLSFFLLKIEIFNRKRFLSLCAKIDDLFAGVSYKGKCLMSGSILQRKRECVFRDSVAEPVSFYDSEMIAIYVDTENSIVLACDQKRWVDVYADEDTPAFAIILEAKCERFTMMPVVRIFKQIEIASELRAADRGGHGFMAVSEANIAKR